MSLEDILNSIPEENTEEFAGLHAEEELQFEDQSKYLLSQYL